MFGDASKFFIWSKVIFYNNSFIFCPISAGFSRVCMPAFFMAENFAFALPVPPETIAPACPMRFPSGAAAPAMNPTMGLGE